MPKFLELPFSVLENLESQLNLERLLRLWFRFRIGGLFMFYSVWNHRFLAVFFVFGLVLRFFDGFCSSG